MAALLAQVWNTSLLICGSICTVCADLNESRFKQYKQLLVKFTFDFIVPCSISSVLQIYDLLICCCLVDQTLSWKPTQCYTSVSVFRWSLGILSAPSLLLDQPRPSLAKRWNRFWTDSTRSITAGPRLRSSSGTRTHISDSRVYVSICLAGYLLWTLSLCLSLFYMLTRSICCHSHKLYVSITGSCSLAVNPFISCHHPDYSNLFLHHLYSSCSIRSLKLYD